MQSILEQIPFNAILVLIVIALVLSWLASRYVKVPPNKALIIFGTGSKDDKGEKRGFEVMKGGGRIIWPVVQSTRELDLSVQTLDVRVVRVPSKEGVRVTVDSVAQIKIGGDDESLRTAAEQLLGKTPQQVASIATQTMEGHLRGIVGTLTVEELNQQRESFQTKVLEQAKPDMRLLGLEVVTITIREVSDELGYIDALGQKRTAEVQRDAAIGEAEAKRTEREAVAIANQAATEVEQKSQIAVELATKDKNVQVADFKKESETARAIGDKAYELQETEINHQLATRQGTVEVERQRQAGLAAQEKIAVAERERQADVVVPAKAEQEAAVAEATGKAEAKRLTAAGDADATKALAAADAEKTRVIGVAQGDADKAKGLGEAAATEARLRAEAAGQRDLAAARAAEGQVNLVQLAIEKHFETRGRVGVAMAEAFAEFGAKVSITQVGGSSNGHGALDVVANSPAVLAGLNAQIEALTGKNLGQTLEEIMSLVRSGKLTELANVASASGGNGARSATESPAAEPVVTGAAVVSSESGEDTTPASRRRSAPDNE